jgi:hypothetical protein
MLYACPGHKDVVVWLSKEFLAKNVTSLAASRRIVNEVSPTTDGTYGWNI